MKHASRVSSGSPNIRYSITNNKKIEKSMSEIFSKNVIINKSDTILMQGNGIFLLGSLDMACETHQSTNTLSY